MISSCGFDALLMIRLQEQLKLLKNNGHAIYVKYKDKLKKRRRTSEVDQPTLEKAQTVTISGKLDWGKNNNNNKKNTYDSKRSSYRKIEFSIKFYCIILVTFG